MQRIVFNAVDEGMEIPSLKCGPITQMDLVRYAGASGDFNPIHNDAEFARSVGLNGTIAHGMYVMAQVGRMCSNWAHPLQIKWFGVKFRGMTLPGETLVMTGKVKKKKEENGEKLITVAVQAANEAGDVKVSGELVIKAD